VAKNEAVGLVDYPLVDLLNSSPVHYFNRFWPAILFPSRVVE
jgi:hypothetical protein